MAFSIEYRALLTEDKAILIEYRALLTEYIPAEMACSACEAPCQYRALF